MPELTTFGRTARGLLTLSALLGALACAPPEVDMTITVSDHEDALAADEVDDLFVIRVRETSVKLPFDDLLVIVKYQEEITEEVEVEHLDHDGDGVLSAEDELSCREPDDLFDDTHLNQEIIVFLDRFGGGLLGASGEPTETLASGVWIPAN